MAAEADIESTPLPPQSAASRWWRISKYAISFCLIAYLAITVDWPNVLAAARAVSVPWLLVSLFYIPAGIFVIALRYRKLINNLVSLRAMIRLVILQGAVATFLANAAGSLSYIGILIKFHKVPAELAIQSTIIARLADLFASLIAAALLAAVAWRQMQEIQSLMLLAMIISLVILALAVAVVVVARRMPQSLFERVANAPRGDSSPSRKILGFCLRLIQLDAGYVAATLPRTLAYSFIQQGVIAISMYCNAHAFHLEIGFFQAALVGIASTFISSIPITVFGGLGVYELSSVGLLALFGVPVEAGAGMILVVRTMFFLVMALAFLLVRSARR